MKYVSLFSGVGSCALASADLGWQCLAFSEIEPLPKAVLAHRFPGIPNVGDILEHDWSQYKGKAQLVVGGPPCQDFSVAGKGKSLDGERGQLSMVYADVINAIEPLFSVTENVPGWLRRRDNPFGAFLAELAGTAAPLLPGRRQKWTDAGLVVGPKRTVAWRTFDAQYFGLAQRRRRVFVLSVDTRACGVDPGKILFEREGSPRINRPQRQTGEEVAGTLGAGSKGSGPKPDTERMTFVPVAVSFNQRAESRVGQVHGALAGNKSATQFDGVITGAVSAKWAKGTGGPAGDECYNLVPVVAAIAFKPSHFTRGKDGAPSEIAPPLSADADKGDQDTLIVQAPVGFSCKDSGEDTGEDISPTLRALSGARPNGGGQAAVALPTLRVRRLTPRECERLQGLPDDWTAVMFGKKIAKDSPRYRAIGNGWAVPCVRWIFERLEAAAPKRKRRK